MPTDPLTLLVLVPLLPLVAALVGVVFGRRLGGRAHLPAVAGIGASAAISLVLLAGTAHRVKEALNVADSAPSVAVEGVTTLWQWATVEQPGLPAALAPAATGTFSIPVALRLDPLTATMLSIITCVGLLVAIYSAGYMHGDPGYPRFFVLVSMFVFSMTMLVAASNFLLVYVFWEAVGACSYLLIGFWYTKPEAARAAKKAFLVNRVGDFGLAVAT